MNTSYVLFLTIILLLVLCSKSDELVYFSNTLEGKNNYIIVNYFSNI